MRSSFRGLLASLACTALFAVAAGAQQRAAITGRVTERASNTPVADANVVLVGTQRGARSDERGQYRIAEVNPGTYTIRVTRIGYSAVTQTVTVPASGTATADFALSQTAVQIDQVMVTATGATERKRENGNDVGIIKPGEKVDLAATPTLTQALAGQTAGLTVSSNMGTPGTSSRIRIRGSNSVSLSNDPLLIIDGIRVDNSSNAFNIGVGGATTNRLDDINPEDIESIEVLKGPAASALYGTAASNGVIQITTKRGHAGATNWRAYADYGHMWDPTQYKSNYFNYGTWLIGAKKDSLFASASGRPANCSLAYVNAGYCRQDSLFTFNPILHNKPMQTGNTVDYGLSAAGGADVAQYYIAGDAQRVQGIVGPSQTHNYNLRANINATLRQNLNAQITTNYIDRYVRLPFNDNNIYGIVPAGTLGKAFNCAPGMTGGTARWCGTDTLSRGYYQYPPSNYFFMTNAQAARRFVGGTNVTWQPLSWLTGVGQAGIDLNNELDQNITPANQISLPNLPSTLYQGSVTEYRREIPTYSANGSFTATHGFSFLGGMQTSTAVGAQYINEQSHYTYGYGRQLIAGVNSLAGATTGFAVGENNQTIITVGGYGREQLSWNDRLFVTPSIRADENSAFGSNFKLAWYPSVSASWVVSEEPAFKNIDFLNSGWLSSLRLRGAYGESGQRPGFRQADTYLAAQAVSVGASDIAGVYVGGTGNPNLKPEISAETEAGFDAGFFDNRVGLVYTYYHKNTKDALIARTLAPSEGVSASQFINVGKVTNAGNELQLNVTAVDRTNTKLDVTISGSTNSNKLLALGSFQGSALPTIFFNNGEQRHEQGYPLGSFFQRKYTYADANHDGVLSPSEVTLGDTTSQAEFIGSPFPTRQLSITPTLTVFKNLKLSGLLDYRGGFYVYNNTEEFRCSSSFSTCQGANDPHASLQDQAAVIGTQVYGTSYGFIQKGDFWKFREASVTYNLPTALLSRTGTKSLGVTLAGHNLGTWTKYKGYDPELNASVATSGFTQFDFLTQPPVRTWTLRVDLGF